MKFDVLVNDDFCKYSNESTLIGIDNAKLLSIVNDFEDGNWRYRKFQDFLWNNIKETALTQLERKALIGNEGEIISKAVNRLRLIEDPNDEYNGKGGEVGEIILYGIMKQHFKALPIVPKIFYKQNRQDFAKGSDSIHIIIENEDTFSLWFGESKFYNGLSNSQIDKVIESISNSLELEKLKKENAIIVNTNQFNDYEEISDSLREKIQNLLSEDTSIDSIKPILNIPILLVHECSITQKFTEYNELYRDEIIEYHKERATTYFKKQIAKCSSIHKYSEIKFHLILFPVPSKDTIEKKFLEIAWANRY